MTDQRAEQTPPDAFRAAFVLIELAADPAGFRSRLDQMMAAGAKLQEVETAAHRAVKAMDAREADLKKREAALAEVEARWQARMANLDQRPARQAAELRTLADQIRDEDARLRRRVLQFSGLNAHFDERLQALPKWTELADEILNVVDTHYGTAGEAGGADGETVTEPAPHVAAGSKLTRTRTLPRAAN